VAAGGGPGSSSPLVDERADSHPINERRPELSASGTTPRPGLRDVFADPSLRPLWSARTVSQRGDTFNFVALALLIYD